MWKKDSLRKVGWTDGLTDGRTHARTYARTDGRSGDFILSQMLLHCIALERQ